MSLTLILFVCIAVSKATIAAIAEYCAYCLPLSAASANTAIFHTLFFFSAILNYISLVQRITCRCHNLSIHDIHCIIYRI